MSTQTVYFNDPADIVSLQATTTSMSGAISSLQATTTSMSGAVSTLLSTSRGTVISCTKVTTIGVGAMNQSAGTSGLTGPNVPVDIYKLVYVTTDPRTTSNEWVSGTLYVPQTISKNTIFCHKRGTTFAQDDESLGYDYLVSSAFTSASPTTRAMNAATYNLIYAGLGYVVCVPDGFGLGVSPNALNYYTYFGEVNPGVDMLRAVRNLIISQPSIFYNYSFPSVLPVVQDGYSLGGHMDLGIAMEFQSGVSDSIPSAESNKFSFKLVFCSAPVDPVAPVISAYLGIQTGATGAALQPSTVTVGGMMWCLARGIENIVARTSANGDIWPLLKGNYAKPPGSGLQVVNGIRDACKYNYVTNPPTPSYDFYYPTTTGAVANWTSTACYDQRQIFDMDKFYSYTNTWYQDLAFTSIHRPLQPLANVPIVIDYSSIDEFLLNIPYVASDTTENYIPYLTTGVIGVGYAYTGAGKTVTTNNTFTQTTSSLDSLASDILSMSTNSCNRYKVTSTLAHTNYGSQVHPRIVYSTLLNLPAY